MNPLISVVMPVVRVDAYVAPAIQSILAQQGVTLELILIGPHAQNPAYAQLEALIQHQCSNDSRCVLVPRQRTGIANVLNQGFAHATGEYIARMDADDLSCANRLQTQLATAQRFDNHCLVGACVKIFSNEHEVMAGNQQYQTWLNNHCTPESIRNACFVESPLPHPTWFAHKSIWDKLRPYQQGDYPEDYDRVLHAWLHKIPMVKPDSILLHWREHTQRLTRIDDRYRREAFIQLKAKALVDSCSETNIHKGRTVWIAGTGRNARYWHDALERHHVTVAGFVDFNNPTAKKYKRSKPVVSYEQLVHVLKDGLLITAITNHKAREHLIQWCEKHSLALGRKVIIGG